MIQISKYFILAIFLVVGMSGCGDHHDHGEVQWSELRKLDELAEFGEAYVLKKDDESIKTLAPKLVKASNELLGSKKPEHPKNPKALEALLDDLKGLKASLEKSESMSKEERAVVVKSYHPLVMKLMESAGLAHKHGKGDACHCDHDHGHGSKKH